MFVFPSNLPYFMGGLLISNGDHLGNPGYVTEEASSGPAVCFTKCITGVFLMKIFASYHLKCKEV